MRNAFSTESNARAANARLGLTPQRRAGNGEADILHIWAVRPAPASEATAPYLHENLGKFQPLRNTRVSNAFRGMDRKALRAEKSKRVAAILQEWGVTPSDDVRKLGEGVSGVVVEMPASVAARALVKSAFIPWRRLPPTGEVAVKFQLVRDEKDLQSCVREAQINAIALSGSNGNGNGGLAQYVPKFFGAFYDDDLRLFVMIMELVTGDRLEDLMQQNAKLTAHEYDRLCRAFYALWRRGIFHSDAHGGNVFIDRNTDKVTFIDFGQSEFIPPQLRPRSFEQAMDPEYQRQLQDYVATVKTGQSWFNPNTRALKIAKAMTVRNRSNGTAARRFANAWANENDNARPGSFPPNMRASGNRNARPGSFPRPPPNMRANSNRTARAGSLPRPPPNMRGSSNRNARPDSYRPPNAQASSNRNARPGVNKTKGNKNSAPTTPPPAEASAPYNDLIVNDDNNLVAISHRKATPSMRKKMVQRVTKDYQNMLNKFVNKSKQVVFIRTTD